jgi:hypothetical protein
MTDLEDAEKALHDSLEQSVELLNLGGSVAKGATFGTLVLLGERPIGLWSHRHGMYEFRELASYDPALEVATVAEAIDVTIALLTLCQSGWAERFGPIAKATRAA